MDVGDLSSGPRYIHEFSGLPRAQLDGTFITSVEETCFPVCSRAAKTSPLCCNYRRQARFDMPNSAAGYLLPDRLLNISVERTQGKPEKIRVKGRWLGGIMVRVPRCGRKWVSSVRFPAPRGSIEGQRTLLFQPQPMGAT